MMKMMFLNLPIANLQRSVEFFTALGFTFNPQFTDHETTCMIINENTFVMLVENQKFASFVNKPIADNAVTEAIFGFACDSADQVRQLAEKAFEMGARKVNEPEDIGFMFSWGFEDLDGHLWDLFWMNPDHVQ